MQETEIQNVFVEKGRELDALTDALHRKIGAGRVTPIDLKETLKVASRAVAECVAEIENRDESSPISSRTLAIITEVLRHASTLIDEVILALAIANPR